MSGVEEVALADAIASISAEEAATAASYAAAEAAAGYGTAAAVGGAAAGGLTAAELAALEAASAEGLLGTGELALGGEAGGGLLSGSGGTLSEASLADALDKASLEAMGNGLGQESSAYGAAANSAEYQPYGAGDTVTNSLTPQPGQGPGMYQELQYKAMNALNKAGGAFNKLPAPVQGLLVSSAIPKPQAPQQHASSYRPPQQQQFAQPLKPTVQPASYQAQPFATSSYGGGGHTSVLGGEHIDPKMLEMLKRLQAQGRL